MQLDKHRMSTWNDNMLKIHVIKREKVSKLKIKKIIDHIIKENNVSFHKSHLKPINIKNA